MAYIKNVVDVPDIPAIVRLLGATMTQKQFAKFTKKPLSNAGKVQAKGVKSGIGTRSNRRRGKKARAKNFKDSSGALKKAIQVVTRKGQDLTPYVVVGVDKKVSVPWKRGKTTVNRRPAHYAHLLETGFVAVARSKGQVGRADERWSPRTIKSGRFDLALKRHFSTETLIKAATYQARYLTAKRTKVSGNWFFALALSSTKSQAVSVLIVSMKVSITEVLYRVANEIKQKRRR